MVEWPTMLGGRSINMGQAKLSAGAIWILKANAKDGWAIDWPIRYRDIAPWYDHVEKFALASAALPRRAAAFAGWSIFTCPPWT